MLCSTKIGTRCLLETGQRLAQVLIPGKPTPLHVRLKARSSVVQLARFLRLRRADRTDEIQNGNAIHHEAFLLLRVSQRMVKEERGPQMPSSARAASYSTSRAESWFPSGQSHLKKPCLGSRRESAWRHGKGGKREDWRIEMQQGLKCLRENQCSDRMNW